MQKRLFTFQLLGFLFLTTPTLAQTLTFGNAKLQLTLDYKAKATISTLTVNGEKVIDGPEGIYSLLKTETATYSTLHLLANPLATRTANTVTLTGIIYGDKDLTIKETWRFTIGKDNITFAIDRTLSKPVRIEQAALPVFTFKNIDTWEGAYQAYGGLAWFYLFNQRSETYGVHSNSSKFWNSKTNNGLSVTVDAPGQEVAMSYSRTMTDQLAYSISTAPNEMRPRFDSGTNRRRFLRDSTNIWAPYNAAGKTTQSITLSYFDVNKVYGRGQLTGINGDQVSAVLNTIARIGVIDKQHFGGNSWHTPYGPICLHEQYIAQLGLAINDPDYLKGYQQCLDFYRDNAIKPDGRVWPRWAYTNEDMMPGEVTDKGFYEAQWGYLLDANPDLVTNVAELYDQTGDLPWVKTHQASCEKALDWICKRDANDNGLVEMMTDSHTQKKGSDWIDIIWSSYENAFVNAKLYHALVLWAAIERRLGNTGKASYYQQFALKLKTSFNKPISDGGFWDEANSCYIHWREKDGSIHGDNMVTPVNFMAIGYGICDDTLRRNAILDKIEAQMQQENLFFWPICLSTYQKGDGNDWQFPFPNYENGDIFLSWGALGVKAYADYKPAIALKYVKNVLAQYAKDGLAFQRYGRTKQDGLGDDILAGNSLSVVGLYQAIYGVNPLYNRFYLHPHLTKDLAGTQLNYKFRDQKLTIDLSPNQYRVSNGRFSIAAANDFGFYAGHDTLLYFDHASDKPDLRVQTLLNANLALDIKTWTPDHIRWNQLSKGRQVYHLNNLLPNSRYTVSANHQPFQQLRTNAKGELQFDYTTGKNTEFDLSLSAIARLKEPKIVNIVNFIRLLEPRDPAITQDVLYQTVVKQIELMRQYHLGGTFLLQYDALLDKRYQTLLRSLPKDSFEIGAWWEIPQPLVENAGLKWRGRYPWDWRANIGFSTGYTPAEREKLIDTYMRDFKKIFGYYPRSVASWFIDAYSLDYMYRKYHIVASANCKDQYGTDGYTLWGGYWNQAYYPSKVNSYMPAQNQQNQINVPIFRMLGSDPVRQYDNGLGTTRQGVVTLEPVYKFGGGDSTWVNWFFNTFTNDESLGFNYTQAGQENSFTWNAMAKGLEIQFPLIARLRNEGRLKVETLEASGRWFSQHFRTTPATAFTVEKDIDTSTQKTAWFDSRYYRANLIWENGHLRIRDIHLFDENFPSIYTTQTATSNECSFFTLPVIDGYLWSKPGEIAGARMMATIDGKTQLLAGGDPIFSSPDSGTLHITWPLQTIDGTLELDLSERQFGIRLKSDKPVDWFVLLTTADSVKLPFVRLEPQTLYGSFEGMNYSVKAKNGFFSKPETTPAIRITPEKNNITLDMGQR